MRRQTRATLLVLLLAAFAWRVNGLTAQSLWRDEVDAVFFATRRLPETLSMFVQAGQNGPLYFLGLRPWFWLTGTAEFTLRYISVMAGTVGVALVWLVAGQLAPARAKDKANDLDDAPYSHVPPAAGDFVPLAAAAFLAANPYQLWYSQEGKMYTIVTSIGMLASWFLWRGITVGGWRPWLSYLLTVTVGLYTHLLLILLFPLHLLWFVIAWPQSRRHWLGYSLALAGLIMPYAPMVWWQWDLLSAQQQMTGFTFTPFPEMLRVLLFNNSRGFMPEPNILWLSPVFFLGAAGIVLGPGDIGNQSHRTDGMPGPVLAPWRRYGMLLSWLVVPVLSIFALSLRQPIFTDRYVMWIAPAAMIYMALGAQAVWHHAGRALRFAAVGLVVYVLVFWLYAGWQQKTLPMKYDLRAGVTYLVERRVPESLLILQIPHLQYAVQYYSSDFGARPFTGGSQRLGNWAEGLWTNHGWADDQSRLLADEQMREITDGASDVWVLRSEVAMWDERNLMEEWLETNGTLVESADFNGVQVRRYSLEH